MMKPWPKSRRQGSETRLTVIHSLTTEGKAVNLYLKHQKVGLDGLEPTTSVLSGPRSNHLSYRPTEGATNKVDLSIIAIQPPGIKNYYRAVSPFSLKIDSIPGLDNTFTLRLSGQDMIRRRLEFLDAG